MGAVRIGTTFVGTALIGRKPSHLPVRPNGCGYLFGWTCDSSLPCPVRPSAQLWQIVRLDFRFLASLPNRVTATCRKDPLEAYRSIYLSIWLSIYLCTRYVCNALDDRCITARKCCAEVANMVTSQAACVRARVHAPMQLPQREYHLSPLKVGTGAPRTEPPRNKC